MELVLRAAFDRYSGYGSDAVDLAVELSRQPGVNLTLHPVSVVPGLPREFTDLLVPYPHGKKDALLWFADPSNVRPWEAVKLVPRQIGYTMWERTPFVGSQDLAWPLLRKRSYRRNGLDALAVTCEMNVAAFAQVADGLPVRSLPCGIRGSDWPVQARPADRQFTFLMHGSMAVRKAPFALLGAWREMKLAYPECDARLVLHTMETTQIHPLAVQVYGPDVELNTEVLTREGVLALYAEADVLVSPSRGEGNDKPCMEFMATGGAVIASDWSGHRNWLDPACTFAVGGRLVQALGAPGCQEFEIDHEQLIETMYEAWSERAETRERGARAARMVRDRLEWSKTVPPLVEFVEEQL